MERQDYYLSKVANHLAAKVHDSVKSPGLKSAIGINTTDEYALHHVEFFNNIDFRLHQYQQEGKLGRFKQGDTYHYYLTSMCEHPTLLPLIEKESIRLEALFNDPSRPKPMDADAQALCKKVMLDNEKPFNNMCSQIRHHTDFSVFDIQELFILSIEADPLLLDCPQKKQAASMVLQNVVATFPDLKDDIHKHWLATFNEPLPSLTNKAALDKMQEVMTENGWTKSTYGYQKEVESLNGRPMYAHVTSTPTGTIKVQGEFISEEKNILVTDALFLLKDTPLDFIEPFLQNIEYKVSQSYSVRCLPANNPSPAEHSASPRR